MSDTIKEYYWLNEDSRTFLNRGYISESPEERVRFMGETAEKYLEIKGFADKFEKYTKLGFYSFSTPVWINFGKDKGLPISCYGSNVSDSMDSIFNTAHEIALMSKYGGGTSAYLGNIRERGSSIRTGGTADGPVHYAKIYDTAVDVSKQAEARRGACAVYLPVEHPDISEFLDIGTEGNPIQNLQYGVTITNEWMKSMIDGDSSKRKIWAKILQRRGEIGFPYIFFKDNVNNGSPYKELGREITASNLCITGDSMINIKLNGTKLRVSMVELNSIFGLGKWTSLEVESYNINTNTIEYKPVLASAMTNSRARVMKITDISSGKSIKCTPDHQIFTKNRGYVMAKDLNEDDILVIT